MLKSWYSWGFGLACEKGEKTICEIWRHIRFGFYPRIPQAPIILYGYLQVGKRNPFSAPFLCSPDTHRFLGASMEPSVQSGEAQTARFVPCAFGKMPFPNLNWGEGRTARWVGLLLWAEACWGHDCRWKITAKSPRRRCPGLFPGPSPSGRCRPAAPAASARGGCRSSHSCLSREGERAGTLLLLSFPALAFASSQPRCWEPPESRAVPRDRSLPSGPAAERSAGRHSQTARQRAIKPSPGQPLTLPPAFSSLWLRRSKGSIKSPGFTGSLKKKGGGEVRGSAREKSLVMAGNVWSKLSPSFLLHRDYIYIVSLMLGM